MVRLIGRPREAGEMATEPFDRPEGDDLHQQLELLAESTGIASLDEMPSGGTGHHHRV